MYFKQKRDSPESPVATVKDPGHPSPAPGPRETLRTVEKSREILREGTQRQLPPAAEPRTAKNLGAALEQTLTSLAAASVQPLKKKSTHLRRRTANSRRLKRTPIFLPVTKEDMTTVNPSAELQPKTSAPPSGPPKGGRSFSLQVTLVTQMMPARMTVNLTPTLSHRDAGPEEGKAFQDPEAPGLHQLARARAHKGQDL
jgi:hypothetical protein